MLDVRLMRSIKNGKIRVIVRNKMILKILNTLGTLLVVIIIGSGMLIGLFCSIALYARRNEECQE
jgi:hypothetical protein